MKTTKLLRGLLLALGLSAGASGALAEQFKFGHYFAAADFRGQTAQKFADYMTEANKDFSVKVFPAESLVKGRDALQATSRGTVDFYSVYTGYITGSMGLMKIFTMPFPERSYTDAKLMDFANDERVIKILDKELNGSNVKLLGFINSTGETTAFLRNPITGLKDLNGLKLRGVGGYSDPALKELGASIVFMSAAEQFIQLETGGVDGVVTTDASYVAQDLSRVAPYMLKDSVLRGPYALIMNKRTWDKLSAEKKAAVEQAVDQTIEWSKNGFPQESKRLIDAVNTSVKSVYELTPKERQQVAALRDNALEQFVQEHGDPAKQLMEIYNSYQQ